MFPTEAGYPGIWTASQIIAVEGPAESSFDDTQMKTERRETEKWNMSSGTQLRKLGMGLQESGKWGRQPVQISGKLRDACNKSVRGKCEHCGVVTQNERKGKLREETRCVRFLLGVYWQ